jgi:CheY-like chemotaxis protein
MVSATRYLVEGTLARIRRADSSVAHSQDALQRSRYRLHGIRGGAAPELPDLSRLAVVIVEANTDNLDVFATFLRACGARVVGARSVELALRQLGVSPADVIMTDVSVLPLGGGQFIEAVRGIPHHRMTPIVAVTGWTEKDVRPAECGFTAFLQKPVDLDHLGAEILRLSRAGAGAVVASHDAA